MPRKGRLAPGGWVYHVVNRGNRRERIFADTGDYLAFLQAMSDALRVAPMRILAWCLMPNHWHMVLWPREDGELSRFVGWVSNTHVRRYNRFHELDGHGHLYQGRFKSFPVQEDYHLLCVLRYVEANPLRAGLVERAEAWPWSSLRARGREVPPNHPPLSDWPVPVPVDWLALVNEALRPEQVEEVRQAIDRGRPCGSGVWLDRTTKTLGLAHTLRRPGRPKKQPAS